MSEGHEDDSIRIETCCPNIIIIIIKFLCRTYTSFYIYILNIVVRWMDKQTDRQMDRQFFARFQTATETVPPLMLLNT